MDALNFGNPLSLPDGGRALGETRVESLVGLVRRRCCLQCFGRQTATIRCLAQLQCNTLLALSGGLLDFLQET